MRKQRLQKCLNGQVMAIYARSPKTRISRNSANGGPREIFQKSPKKLPSFERPKSTVAEMPLSSNKYALKLQTGEEFGANSGSKSAEMSKVRQFSQGHPKPAFSEKVQKGDQEKFFKNRLKRRLRLKGLKARWCRWHCHLISMRLNWKDWRLL